MRLSPLKLAAQELILKRWADMTELERDAWTLYFACITHRIDKTVLDLKMRLLLIVLFLAITFIALLLAGLDDLPAPLFLSAGFLLGVGFFWALALAILKGIKNKHNGK